MLLVILRFNIQPKSTQQALHWHVSTPPSSSPSFLVLLVNTVVPLLAKQENKQPCGIVHMFTLGVLSTTAQTTNKITTTGVTGTQDPTVIPMATGKKKARDMDPALRTWLRGHVTRKRIRNTKWAPRGLAVDLVQPVCMTWTKKACLSTSGRFHSMDRLLLTGTSYLT